MVMVVGSCWPLSRRFMKDLFRVGFCQFHWSYKYYIFLLVEEVLIHLLLEGFLKEFFSVTNCVIMSCWLLMNFCKFC